jgi:hypothetical protein
MDIFDIANDRVNRITRYFRRNEGTTDYATIPAVTLSGGFEISIYASLQSMAAASVMLGDAANLAWFRINTDGSIQVKGAGASSVTAAGIVVDDKVFRLYNFKRTGSSIELRINESLVHTFTGYTGDMAFNRIYQKANTNYFPGTIANLSIVDAGALVRSYPINEPSGTTTFDEVSGQDGAIVLGSDDDRGLFQEVARGGNWQGSSLVVPPWDSANQILVVA